jgi:hypothetical protein
LGALRVISVGPDLGILGYYPVTCVTCPQAVGKTSAVFRLVDEKARERWKYVQQSSQPIYASDIVRNGDGFILVGFTTDYSPQPQPSTISLTRISDTGAAQKENIVIPLRRRCNPELFVERGER